MKTTTNIVIRQQKLLFQHVAKFDALVRRGFQHLPPMKFSHPTIKISTKFNNRYKKLRNVSPAHYNSKTPANCNDLTLKCSLIAALSRQPRNRPNRIILQPVSLKQAFLNFDF